MATIKIDGSSIRQVLLETGWVEVRDFRATAGNQTVDGVAIGASVTFETRHGKRTIPASSVLDVYTVSADAEAEAEADRRAEDREREARLFHWQHYTDRDTYERLAEAQNGRCGECGTLLGEARFVHLVRTDDGPVLLHRDFYAGCSPLAPRLGGPTDG